ncbi:hypothetical protein NONI108955_05725 [Nocardia ninae]|uniref:Uncharacterized protein n=1 Tax=Nocardia ninae NBRC 108245 TaxID=1210091 RepID=A0A511MEF7_9NOCA|nr:hypothetical protein [Nocardia ninae]GEM38861.1 hypothetical protein NN4_33800 [Nocardia ninae NBRC 108245]
MTDTITREDFDRRAHFGDAGPTSVLDEAELARWRKQHPDWKGKFWSYLPVGDEDHLLRVQPVNVATRPKARR